MKKIECSIAVICFFLLGTFYFYQTVLHGFIPFPGDLLLAEYNPWKTYGLFGYQPGGYPTKGQYFDVLRQLYPWKTLGITLLKQGILPLWNPYSFSGTPLLANFQSALFYPLNVFYFLIPQIFSWTLLVFLQPVLAGFFTYLYARKIRLSPLAACLSAVAFSYCSFMIVWLEYNSIDQVVLWLPLGLFCIEILLKKIQIPVIILFLFSLFASLSGGHPQIFMYVLLFEILYAFVRIQTTATQWDQRKKQYVFFALLFFHALLLGSILVIPGFELIQLSARSGHSYKDIVQKILIQPSELLMIVIPDFFGNPVTRNFWLTDTYVGDIAGIGIIPLFFVCLSLKYWKNRFIQIYLFTALVVLLLTTQNPFTSFFYSFQIPFFSSSAPTLSIFLFCFSLSMLAGFGIEYFQKEKIQRNEILLMLAPIVTIIGIIGIIVLGEGKLGLLQGSEHAHIALRGLLYETFFVILAGSVILMTLKWKKYSYIFISIIIMFTCLDSWHSFNKFNPFVPRQLVFPPVPILTYLQKTAGINRTWGYGFADIEANMHTQFSLFSPEGYDPLYAKRYGEFIYSSNTGHLLSQFSDQTRSDAIIARSSNSSFTNQFRQKVLNILGVKYIYDRFENTSTELTFPPETFRRLYADSGWVVYQNTRALPRAFIVNDYSLIHSGKEFEQIFFDPKFDSGKSILLEKKIPVELHATQTDVRIAAYAPNFVRMQTQTNGTGLLFLSDSYYPGWTATVDGKQTEIYRADYTFRAIVLPKGRHSVSFTISSTSFKIGSSLSILGLVSGIVWIFFIYMQRIPALYAKK